MEEPMDVPMDPASLRIRPASPADAGAYLDMLLQLDRETDCMMYEPDERTATPESIAETLRRIAADGGLTLVVEDGTGRLLGFLSAERGFARRIRHIVYIVVGLREPARGQGVGARLFAELERWAAANGVWRLELTVMTQNYPAVRLYEKVGFIVEGYREQALVLNGEPVNEFAMARLLPHEGYGPPR